MLLLAAQVLLLPVMAYHFRRLSLTILIVNPLVLPVQPAVMVLGGLALDLGLVFHPLGQAIAYLVWPMIAYIIRVVEAQTTIPGGHISLGNITLIEVIVFYAVLFLLIFARAPPQARLACGLAALVHILCVLPGAAVTEVLGDGQKLPSHTSQECTFKDGKLGRMTGLDWVWSSSLRWWC